MRLFLLGRRRSTWLYGSRGFSSACSAAVHGHNAELRDEPYLVPVGEVGWERVGTAFPHLFALLTLLVDLYYIKTWLRSHRCASDTQMRLLVKSLQ